MVSIELSRQEIWTILCWAGDPKEEIMPHSYNTEEASVIRKLRAAMDQENLKLKEMTAAAGRENEPE